LVAYEFRCPQCGVFARSLPMATVTPSVACPGCGGPATRVYTPPMTPRTPSPLARLRATEEASSDAPRVVSEPPKVARRARPPHPALARLPKP
jgi:putative FmdB family regulatory protein